MLFILVVIYGLMVGSFLNVCIYRIPKGESIVKPRSRCPHCRHQLTVWENIPVFSYLFLRGKCSSCKAPISPRYALVEILTAAVFAVVYWQFGLTLDFFFFTVFLCLVIVITFIDLDHQIIPNQLLLIGIIPGLYPLFRDGWDAYKLYLIGALALGLGFYAIAVFGQLAFRKESMGMGDIKYAALIGLTLGWQSGIVATALAFVSASVLFLFLMPFKKITFGQRIPFGPFLSLGTFFALIWGPDIIQWYFQQVF